MIDVAVNIEILFGPALRKGHPHDKHSLFHRNRTVVLFYYTQAQNVCPDIRSSLGSASMDAGSLPRFGLIYGYSHPKYAMNSSAPLPRRHLLAAVAAATAGAAASTQAAPAKPAAASDGPPHKIVYQLNRAEPEYQEAILNSIGAMLKKYVDDVSIVVVAWGPGLHLLAKKPKRPVAKALQQRARGMSESYGIEFIACGNTMHSLHWEKADMLDFVKIEDVGAAAVMELQEKGYAYLAW